MNYPKKPKLTFPHSVPFHTLSMRSRETARASSAASYAKMSDVWWDERIPRGSVLTDRDIIRPMRMTCDPHRAIRGEQVSGTIGQPWARREAATLHGTIHTIDLDMAFSFEFGKEDFDV